MADRSGWTFEAEAAAGPIGGHAGTRMAQGLAAGDTIGGTTDLAHHPDLAHDDAREPETARVDKDEAPDGVD